MKGVNVEYKLVAHIGLEYNELETRERIALYMQDVRQQTKQFFTECLQKKAKEHDFIITKMEVSS